MADAVMVRYRELLLTALAVLVLSVALGVGALFAGTRIVADAAEAVAETSERVDLTPPPVFLWALPTSGERVDAVSFVFVGDVMLDRTVASRIRRTGDDAYPFAMVMSDPRFTDADVHVMNLEGPVTTHRAGPDKGEVDFMFDPRFVPVLKAVGFDAASQANNHAYDQGATAAEASRRLLSDGGLLVFGDEVDEGDVAFATTTVRGRRIAFVGFNETASKLDETVASSTLALARRNADTVIAFMHWGAEYQDRPTRAVQERAHWLIDHGVDIVVGGHPHWTQGISVYDGKPILWSLGNFVFDQDWSTKTGDGLAVRILVSGQETSIELNPVRIDASQPRFLDGDERDVRLRDLATVSDASLTHQILQGNIVIPKE
ncbi:CapA family protein [Patescibacteria group bacterium]|nr:CapA family protein [Patescibacteria group bacterium]